MSESEYKKRNAAAAALDSEVEVDSDFEEEPRPKKGSSSKSRPKKQPEPKKSKAASSAPPPPQKLDVSTELFGGDEPPQQASTSAPLWSSISRRVVGGVLRNNIILDGDLFFDVRVYNTADIINLNPRERPDKTQAHLRLQVNATDENWKLIKLIFANAKKKFDKDAVFYGDKAETKKN